MRQTSSRYCKADIISRLIWEGPIPDNEEGQGFYKLNVMERRRMLCIFVCL